MLLLKPLTFILLLCFCFELEASAQKQQVLRRDNADEYYDEAVKQTKLRNYKTAIYLCRQGLSRRENFMDMHLLIGKLYTLTKNYDSARFHIKHVITHDPRYKDAYFYAINIEASTNRFEEALCFADDGLYFFPNDKELLLKKLSLLEQTRRIQASISLADKIIDRFPTDTRTVLAYVEHKLTLGRYYMKRGSITQARLNFESALAVDPSNREALTALYNIEIKSGNHQAALNRINFALIRNPNSYELLMSKLGTLQEMRAYAEALEVLAQIKRYYPGDAKASRIESELRLEAARYYLTMDPLMQYQSVLEKEPGNREAMNRVIGINTSRGNYREAMNWVNKGMRLYPNDDVLLGQKIDLLEIDRKFTEASFLADRIYQRSGSSNWRNRMVELKIASSQYYANQEIYDTALMELDRALEVSPNNYNALERKVNILISQNAHSEAMDVVDYMLTLNPDDEKLILRMSAIHEKLGNREEAANLTSELLSRNPDNKKYTNLYIEQRLAAARDYLQQDEPDLAREQLRLVLDLAPENIDALNYLINLESGTHRLDSALYYADRALQITPSSRDLLLKKSSILQDMHRFQEAYGITNQLMVRFPSNSKVRQAYLEQVTGAGREYAARFVYDSALLEYRKVLDLAPADTLALMYSINLLSDKGMYDTALVLVNQGLAYYPNSEYFHMKKAVIMEGKKNFVIASAHADTAYMLHPSAKNLEYREYLKGQSYRNQFGLFFLKSSFDQGSNANIATVEYRRFYNRGNFAARLNFAGRDVGTGYQLDAETYYNHDSSNYSYAVASVADGLVFPSLRGGYSFFHNFPKWEAEIGARYLLTQNDGSVISLVASGAKEFGDFWANLRGFFIFQQSNFFQSYNLTNRYYLNDNSDYIQLALGFGTSPDDFSRTYLIGSSLNFVTTSIGATYQRSFGNRNKLLLSGTWINYKIADGVFINQYDLYVQFQRRF